MIEAAKAKGVLIENLLDLDFGAPPTLGITSPVSSKLDNLMDLMSMDGPIEIPDPPAVVQETFLSPDSAKGLGVTGSFSKK